MKTFLLITIFVICIVIGANIKKYYINRRDFYKSLNEFAKNYRSQVLSTHEKLTNILREEKLKSSNKIFNNLIEDFESFVIQEIDKEKFETQQYKNLYFLNKTEICEIFSFLYEFGKFDIEEESLRLNDKISLWDEKSKVALFQEQKYGGLIFKLFLIFGFFFVIVFI